MIYVSMCALYRFVPIDPYLAVGQGVEPTARHGSRYENLAAENRNLERRMGLDYLYVGFLLRVVRSAEFGTVLATDVPVHDMIFCPWRLQSQAL